MLSARRHCARKASPSCLSESMENLRVFSALPILSSLRRSNHQLLHKDRVRISMLSGDSRTTAMAVATRLGIDDVQAEILPTQKADAVRRLQSGGHIVAMAGDGINDAPALAAANVGIAMGTGTDVAMESAGITLLERRSSAASCALYA